MILSRCWKENKKKEISNSSFNRNYIITKVIKQKNKHN